jgi:glucokinase
MILAADVGATNARVGLFEFADQQLVPVTISKFRNSDYKSFGAVLDAFLGADRHITSACFGIAGPVIDGKVHLTNLNWTIDQRECESQIGGTVSLLNDMEATGYGISQLRSEDLLVLNAGFSDGNAAAALIAAGTGLGESALQRNGLGRIPVPAEAGHADFAPNNDLETELLLYLRRKFGHVSWDRVLSGPGLHLIYEFLRDTDRGKEKPEIAELIRAGDPGAVISRAALRNDCELCVRALDIFVSIYGSESGNMALRYLARAGVYLGGGIAPKIRTKLTHGNFMKAFAGKGRMKAMLELVPVYVILNDQAALLGAAHYAATRSSAKID